MRLLFLTTAPPWPPRRGYQMRLAGLINSLAARHEIHVLAQSPPGFDSIEPPVGVELKAVEHGRQHQARGLLSSWRLPIQVALHHTPDFRKRILNEMERVQPDVVIGMLSRLGSALLDLPAPTVVDLIDCLGLNMERRARQEPWLRPFWSLESRRMFVWERHIAAKVAATTVVSERDRKALMGQGELAEEKAPTVVPLGLEIKPGAPKVEERKQVVLLSGNLGYFPTVEGGLWFAREIWPRVRAEVPALEFWLAGSRPASKLAELGEEKGIRLIRDPADLSVIRQQVRVAIAPLRAGSGTPIKVLESMADGLPVVTTTAGQAGLDGLRGGEVKIADSADGFAAAMIELLRDDGVASQQVEQAFDWLVRHHSVEGTGDAFEEVLKQALG